MTDSIDLPDADETFIVEKTVEGYTPQEIAYLLRTEKDSRLTDSTVERFLTQDEVVERIELERSIQEKNAEVSRDELIRDLREQKEILKERSQQLRDSENDMISNDTVSNLLSAIKDLAEMIDVLESKDGSTNNVVNINSLEQNFDITSSVQYLSAEDKRSIVEQLEDDEDVKDFVIIRDEDVEDDEKDEKEEVEE